MEQLQRARNEIELNTILHGKYTDGVEFSEPIKTEMNGTLIKATCLNQWQTILTISEANRAKELLNILHART